MPPKVPPNELDVNKILWTAMDSKFNKIYERQLFRGFYWTLVDLLGSYKKWRRRESNPGPKRITYGIYRLRQCRDLIS